MMRPSTIATFLIVVAALIPTAAARPTFLAIYEADPFRRPDLAGCALCHVNPAGGGPRNEFGSAFGEANHRITPLLRATFANNFKFDSAKLSDGSTFYFSDPENKYVVFERNNQKRILDLSALAAVDDTAKQAAPTETRMSFFITSKGPGNGGHLGGLTGADAHCQSLAESVGAGDRTWRAYLSTSFEGQPAINAGDRIGGGPWYNAKGVLVASGVIDLHKQTQLNEGTARNEKGELISTSGILTGSLPGGTAAVDLNCNNWLSDEGNAMLGHAGDQRNAGNTPAWNSGLRSSGCSQEALGSSGSEGLFYCFAIK
jgi:hypothetical protein